MQLAGIYCATLQMLEMLFIDFTNTKRLQIPQIQRLPERWLVPAWGRNGVFRTKPLTRFAAGSVIPNEEHKRRMPS